MGKYDNCAKTNGPNEAKSLYLKMCIANELAEANRLKRLEIELNHTGVWKEEYIERLEDKA